MTERPAALPTSSHWDRWTHLSHRYVMPVAAGTAVTFGAALLADYPPAVLAYLPALLLAVGLVALSTSFAFLAARRRTETGHVAAAPGERVRAGPVRPPFVRDVPKDPRPTDAIGSVWPTSFARTDPWSGSLTASSVGDRLWREWLPVEGEPLGAEIIGPVPETLYSPRGAGAPDPFPYREEDLLFIEKLAEASEGDDGPSAFGLNGGEGWSTGSFSMPDLSRNVVEVEALNAVPPHLRATVGPRPRSVGPVSRGAPVAGAPRNANDSCSTCLVTLDRASRWEPCPGCFQPICPDCVIDSLASYGATGCAGCVQGRSTIR
jgi:hypothetical protein